MIFENIKNRLSQELKVKNGDFYWILFKCIIVNLLLLLGLFVPLINYIAFFLTLILMTFESGVKKIYYLIYFLPYNHVFTINVNTISFNSILLVYFCILIGIRYVIDLFKKDKTLDWIAVALIGAVMIYSLLPINGNFDLIKSFTIILSVLVCYLILQYKEEINLKEIFIVLFIATLTSCIIALFASHISRLDMFLQTIYVGDVIRFSGLLLDPNYFALEIISLLSIATILYYHDKINIFFFVSTFLFTIFGIMSCSKSFILVYAVWLTATLILIIFKFRKRIKLGVLIALLLCLVIAISSLVCFNYTKQLLSRFNDVSTYDYVSGPYQEDKENDELANITTGRSEIWIEYLKEMKNNPIKLIFGHGVGAEYLIIHSNQPTTIHNSLIQALYYYGLLGCFIIFVTIAYLCIRNFKKKHFSIFNYIPIFIIGIMMCSLDCLIGYRLFITILLVAYSFNLTKQNEISGDTKKNAKKKRLLLVSRNLTCGGVERSLLNFINNMKNIYEIDVMLMQKCGGMIDQLEDCNIYEMKGKMKFYGFESVKKRNFIVKLFYFGIKVIRKLFSFCPLIVKGIVAEQEVIEGYDYAICYYNDPFCMEYVASKVKAKKKLLIVHVESKCLKACEMPKGRLKQYYKVLGVSQGHSEQIADKFNFLKDKIDYLYNFQNIEDIISKSSEKIDVEFDNNFINFITVARVAKVKGPFRLANCVKRLRDEGYNNFVVRWVGYGQLSEKLMKYVNDNNLQNCFVLLGAKSNPYPFIKNANCFVLSSYGEACPMVYAESMALNVPIISTKNVSADEIIGGYGLVCENSDEALYQAMKKVLDNKQILEEYKIKLKEYKFDTEKIKQKVVDLLEN